MNRCKFLVAFALLAMCVTNSLAVENATTATLKKEIAALKAPEKVVVKAIHAQYDAMINRDKVAEVVLEKERAAVTAQEKELLATTKNEEQRAEIRARYDEVRRYLSKDIHLDAVQIAKLRELRHAHVKQIEAVFHANIKTLEAELHAIEHAPKTTGPKTK